MIFIGIAECHRYAGHTGAMDTWSWICAGVLAVVHLGAGVFKLITPYEKIAANPNLAWATDFTPHVVKASAGWKCSAESAWSSRTPPGSPRC